jgi:hypothetical protein
MPQTGSFTAVVLFIVTFLRFRIEVSNRRADLLSKSAHSVPTNRLYPQRLTNTCAPHDSVRFPAMEFKWTK